MLVDEYARGQRCGIHLTRREQHLSELAADLVPVVVDGEEVVVRTDRLDLPERLQQRLAIPEANVVDGRAVRRDELRGEPGVGAELALLDGVEPPGLARRADVVGDLRR